MSLSRAIFEITGLKDVGITTFTFQGFDDVIDDVIIRSANTLCEQSDRPTDRQTDRQIARRSIT